VFGEDDGAGGTQAAPRRDRAAVIADLRRKLAGGSGWAGAGGGVAGSVGSVAGGDEGSGAAAPFRSQDPSPSLPRAGAGPAGSGLLAVPGPLAEVVPHGGVPRGSVVRLASTAPGSSGTTSLLLTLLAAPRGVWSAVVGMPGLGVLAAAELGVDLDRLGLIPDPGPDVLQVLSVLADGVDVIAAVAPPRIPPARARVLTGRLRQQGAVLLVVGHWPGADLALTVTDVRWSGIGQGHGRLRDREIDVEVGGRRAGGGARTTMLLRSTRVGVSVEPTVPAASRRSMTPPAIAGAGAG
jgi:hypothetical protein